MSKETETETESAGNCRGAYHAVTLSALALIIYVASGCSGDNDANKPLCTGLQIGGIVMAVGILGCCVNAIGRLNEKLSSSLDHRKRPLLDNQKEISESRKGFYNV